MKKIFSLLVTFISFLILLFVGALIAIALSYYYVDHEILKPEIESQVKKQFNIDLNLDGQLKLDLFPIPSVSVTNVSAGYDLDGEQNKFFAKSDELAIYLSLKTFSWHNITNKTGKEFKFKSIIAKNITLNSQTQGKSEEFKIDYFKGKLDTAPGLVELNDFTMRLFANKTTLSGDLSIALSENEPKVTGKIVVNRLEVVNNKKQKAKSSKLFSSEPIDLKLLAKGNLDLDLKVDDLTVDGLNFKSNSIIVSNTNKVLDIQHNGRLEGGRIKSELSIDVSHSKNNPRVKILASLDGANAANVLRSLDPGKPHKGGKLDFNLYGSSNGNSLAKIMSDFTGKFNLTINKMDLYRQVNVPTSVSGIILNSAVPKNKHKTDTLECLAVNLAANKGIINFKEKIGLETSKLNGLASGNINLRNETLSMAVNLNPRSGVPIKLIDIDNFFTIGGTLKNPTVDFSPAGVIVEGGTMAASVATGGLALIAKQLFNVMENTKQPCKTVLTGR